MFHRGHERSGHIARLVDELDLPEFDVFAWNARGHGRSPGARPYAVLSRTHRAALAALMPIEAGGVSHACVGPRPGGGHSASGGAQYRSVEPGPAALALAGLLWLTLPLTTSGRPAAVDTGGVGQKVFALRVAFGGHFLATGPKNGAVTRKVATPLATHLMVFDRALAGAV